MVNILPPENDQPPTSTNQKPSGGMAVLFAAIPVLAGFSFIIASIVFHPVQAYGAAILVIVVTAPLWFMAARAMEVKAQLFITDKALRGNATGYRLMLWVSCACFALGIVYTLNATLDTSPEETFTPVVVGKDYTTGKRSKSYYAIVVPVTAMDISGSMGGDASSWLDNEEHIKVSRQIYDMVEVGVTRAQVTIKRGFFGIPWVVRDSVVIDRAAIVEGEVNKQLARTQGHNRDYLLGVAYFKGQGMPKDDIKAVEYFRKGAEAGDASAQHSLAYMYSTGLGGLVHDWAQANRWLRKAADQGHASAQDDLGVSYGDGRGIEQDWVQAYMWIDLAAKQGNAQAIKDLDYAKVRMNSEQIEQAKRLSDAWHKTEISAPERAF